MNNCIVNKQGEMLEILQNDREIQHDEITVSLVGYYEVFNAQRYNKAIYDFDLKSWVGIGEQIQIASNVPTYSDRLLALEQVISSMLGV